MFSYLLILLWLGNFRMCFFCFLHFAFPAFLSTHLTSQILSMVFSFFILWFLFLYTSQTSSNVLPSILFAASNLLSILSFSSIPFFSNVITYCVVSAFPLLFSLDVFLYHLCSTTLAFLSPC